jgi:uncharacterized Fe-S cluster protein YjdI
MEKEITKKYSNGEITIVWKPAMCIHSTICWKQSTGLPDVFNPRERPWIKMEGGLTKQIEEQVKKCPSGALSFYYNDKAADESNINTDAKIEVMSDGPLLVYGNITIKDSQGVETKKYQVTALCRCGQSQNKPYCDGSHITSEFKG